MRDAGIQPQRRAALLLLLHARHGHNGHSMDSMAEGGHCKVPTISSTSARARAHITYMYIQHRGRCLVEMAALTIQCLEMLSWRLRS